MIRKKRNLQTKMSASVGMEIGKGIDSFIKHSISGDVKIPCSDIKALKPFVHVAITKKRTLLGPILEFPVIVGA